MKIKFKELLKYIFGITMDRLKVLFLISLTIVSLCAGLYYGITTLCQSFLPISIFIGSCVGVWFGIGMIDMFNDLTK